jgi:DNA-binding NarL/FixJ family response regulator
MATPVAIRGFRGRLVASKTLSVAVCDPSEISRLGIALALERAGLSVSGNAADRQAALDLAVRGADVLLVDLALAGWDDVIQVAVGADSRVIAVGSATAADDALAAIRAGACGYLMKNLPVAAWIEAIRAAMRGEIALSRSMTTELVDAFRKQAAAPASDQLAIHLPSAQRLTSREWEVLGRIAEGVTNRQVAGELCLSVETVRTHVSNILAKLEAPNRAAAAAKYQQLRTHVG